jgi:hypothetical protein
MLNEFDNKHHPADGTNMKRYMTRNRFLKRVIQAGLLALLALLFFSLKNRIETGSSCNGCPQYGRCNGIDSCTR